MKGGSNKSSFLEEGHCALSLVFFFCAGGNDIENTAMICAFSSSSNERASPGALVANDLI